MIVPPAELSAALTALAEGPGRRTSERVARIQARYRNLDPAMAAGLGPVGPLDAEDATAYAVYRMPATYAAVRSSLAELAAADPAFAPGAVVDLGSGTGAAAWAAADAFPDLSKATLLDRDAAMTAVGQELARGSRRPAVRAAAWIAADLPSAAIPAADLAVAGYALGELPAPARADVIGTAAATCETIVVVEPGTPRGFAVVREIRSQLLQLGFGLAAPCPHALKCPMSGSDWCHMAVRLPRSAAHRRAKGATLGYEDEKFAYVAATRRSVRPPANRVVRHPQVRPGRVQLRLCTGGGELRDVTVAKREGPTYKAARRIRWGDGWGTPEQAVAGDDG